MPGRTVTPMPRCADERVRRNNLRLRVSRYGSRDVYTAFGSPVDRAHAAARGRALGAPSGIVPRRRLDGFFDGFYTGCRNGRRRRGNGRRRGCDRRGRRGGCFGCRRRSRWRGDRTCARGCGGIRRSRLAPEAGEPRHGEEEKKPAAQGRQPQRGLRFFGDRLVVGVGGRCVSHLVFGVRCVVVRGSVAHVSAPWRATA